MNNHNHAVVKHFLLFISHIILLPGENRRSHNLMSQEGTRGYYKAGYTNLVTAYRRQGLIHQNQKERMMEWVKQDKHEDINSPEYLSIKDSLEESFLCLILCDC